MSDQDKAERRPAPRRWLMVLLFLSLAVNLVVAGAVIGHFVRGPGQGWHVMRALYEMPHERRDALRELLEEGRDKLRPLRREVREAWRAAALTLAKDPLDRAEVEAAIEAATAKELAARRKMVPVILDLSEKLSADERKLLVRVMLRWVGGRGPRHRRGRDRWRGHY